MSRKPNIAKLAFITSGSILGLTAAFLLGANAGYQQTPAFLAIKDIKDKIDLVRGEWSNLAGTEPIHFLQPAKHEGSGVTKNLVAGDDLVLISGLFDDNNGIVLMKRDGQVLAKWDASYSRIMADAARTGSQPETDWNVDLHGALILPDGSVVYNYEDFGTAKLTRCGDIVWRQTHPTHHSIERAEGGGFWVLGTNIIEPSPDGDGANPFPPFTDPSRWTELPVSDDLIVRLSDEGEILETASIMRAIYDSGLAPLMTAIGAGIDFHEATDTELVHSNKVAELSSEMAGAFPGLSAGDLIVSVRGYNLLLVIDPNTWRVKWHKTGPWIRQHDPEFHGDGSITVFNNNTYLTSMGPQNRQLPGTAAHSTITRYSFVTGKTDTVYGGTEDSHFLSIVRGKHDPTPGGGFLITEFEAGRAFEVDENGELIWEYINRYDDERVAEITEARRYDRDYFTVTDWTCPET